MSNSIKIDIAPFAKDKCASLVLWLIHEFSMKSQHTPVVLTGMVYLDENIFL